MNWLKMFLPSVDKRIKDAEYYEDSLREELKTARQDVIALRSFNENEEKILRRHITELESTLKLERDLFQDEYQTLQEENEALKEKLDFRKECLIEQDETEARRIEVIRDIRKCLDEANRKLATVSDSL